MSDKLSGKKLSVIVPVCERADQAVTLYQEYKEVIATFSKVTEFIYVVSDDNHTVAEALGEISHSDSALTVVKLNRNYGEATAMEAGLAYASGDYILKLPPYKQVETNELYKLFEKIGEYDLVLAVRWPRLDGQINQSPTRLFNALINKFTDQQYHDMGCGVRLITRTAMEEIHLYGNQHRFLPLLAHQLGFSSTEVELKQAADDAYKRIYRPTHYISRFLDLITIIFLTQFSKKPLRFFGLFGSVSIIVGSVGLLYLAYERLFLGMGLADRPLLVMFSMFFVLGIQLLGIGLVGETVIFTHSQNSKEYRVKEIIN